MNSRALPLPLILFALAACCSIPVILEAPRAGREDIAKACERVYSDGPWTLVHSIEITLPGGGRSVMLGVSAWDPSSGRLQSALMSPEGVVLFQGTWQAGGVDVERALPPLDRPDFASGLFSDVRFLFLAPPRDPDLIGRLDRASLVCRWRDGERTVDLAPRHDEGWVLREYEGRRLRREAVATELGADGSAGRIDFTVRGLAGYRMVFERVIEQAAPTTPHVLPSPTLLHQATGGPAKEDATVFIGIMSGEVHGQGP